jgi:hypothetical protein
VRAAADAWRVEACRERIQAGHLDECSGHRDGHIPVEIDMPIDGNDIDAIAFRWNGTDVNPCGTAGRMRNDAEDDRLCWRAAAGVIVVS